MPDTIERSEIVDKILAAKPAMEEKVDKPPMWNIVLINDNTSDFKFVIRVLNDAFSIDGNSAKVIMMKAHFSGSALVKTTTKELAEHQLETARQLIANAQPGPDYVGPVCELTFDLQPEEREGKT